MPIIFALKKRDQVRTKIKVKIREKNKKQLKRKLMVTMKIKSEGKRERLNKNRHLFGDLANTKEKQQNR